MRNLHHTRVKAIELSFADHVTPPGDKGVEHTEHADTEDQRSGSVHMMHPTDGADRQDEGGHRPDRRPWARINQVVVVVLGVSVGHRLCLR